MSKIVAQGISRSRAEKIVSNLSAVQIADAMKSAKALKAIIDVPT